jgi:hypothetical protein
VSAAAAASGLFLGKEYGAFGLALGGGLHRDGVRGTDTEEMMQAAGEKRSAQERLENVGEKQVWDGFKAIASCGMSGDLDA